MHIMQQKIEKAHELACFGLQSNPDKYPTLFGSLTPCHCLYYKLLDCDFTLVPCIKKG